MDINDFRAWHTVVMLITFFGIVFWAYSKKRKSSFDDAANLPFADEQRHEATLKKESEHE
jgi:cytochrome c oxidase cbb3-type subunit 4